MTPERFQELIDAYGADDRRWPEAERAAALALLGRAPELGARLEAARRLDALIDAWPVSAAAPDPAALVARAAGTPQEQAGGTVLPFAPRRKVPARAMVWARAGALAAAAVCGLAIGLSDPTMPANGAGGSVLDLYDVASADDTSW